MADNMNEELNVEEALKKLETMIKTLENPETSLKDSLEIYKEGVLLADLCKNKLEGVEKELKILSPGEDASDDREGFF